jgi:GNAT superfamily N-acetyltransferase
VLIERPGHLLVENVAVDPSRQGGGIGRFLMAFAETYARERGLGELRLYTNEAMHENLRFYPRLGYREDGRRLEDGFRRVYFVKRLGPQSA